MAKIIVKAPFYKPGHKTEKGQSRGGYAQYIGTREGVEILRSGMAGYIGERHGSHGLFSDEGVDVSLSKISEEIDNHRAQERWLSDVQIRLRKNTEKCLKAAPSAP